MPDRKPDPKDDKPVELKNPATAAHAKDAEPKPMTADSPVPAVLTYGVDAAKKPAPKAKAEKPKAEEPAPPPEPKPCPRTITELLADRTFDPEGLVRSALARISVASGGDQSPPLDLVNEDGTPVRPASV